MSDAVDPTPPAVAALASALHDENNASERAVFGYRAHDCRTGRDGQPLVGECTLGHLRLAQALVARLSNQPEGATDQHHHGTDVCESCNVLVKLAMAEGATDQRSEDRLATAAGKALLEWWNADADPDEQRDNAKTILAIEAEARAEERERWLEAVTLLRDLMRTGSAAEWASACSLVEALVDMGPPARTLLESE